MAIWYLDTSALMKVFVQEEHAGPMRRWLSPRRAGCATSGITRVELVRSLARYGFAPQRAAEALLDRMTLIEPVPAVLEAAASLPPDRLRSLDAIHLASARFLDEDLHGIVTYDRRLADAAREHGVAVETPT